MLSSTATPLHVVVASVGDRDPTLGIGGDAGRSQRAAEAELPRF